MTASQAAIWKCDYCGAVENQCGPRSMSMPMIPPDGWVRIDLSRFREVSASKERQKSEELQTIRRDACPACKGKIEEAVIRGTV